MKRRHNKRKIWVGVIGLAMVTVLLTGCGRSEEEGAELTPTPASQGQAKKITVRALVDRGIPSMIDRYMEVQIVELVNGQIPESPVVVGGATKNDFGHTQGLSNEVSVPVTAQVVEGKEYGVRVGVFDNDLRETMLLTSECKDPNVCRFFPNSQINSFQLQLIPMTDAQTLYAKGVPEEIRAKCLIKPDGTKCGINRTMQYYDEARDTCYGAAWGSCEETKTFKSSADCLTACRKNW